MASTIYKDWTRSGIQVLIREAMRRLSPDGFVPPLPAYRIAKASGGWVVRHHRSNSLACTTVAGVFAKRRMAEIKARVLNERAEREAAHGYGDKIEADEREVTRG